MAVDEDDPSPNGAINNNSQAEEVSDVKTEDQEKDLNPPVPENGNVPKPSHEDENEVDDAVVAKDTEIEMKEAVEGYEEMEGRVVEVEMKTRQVSSLQLFRFAGPFEILLIVFAIVLSFAQGIALPLVLFFFGRVTDSFIDVGQQTYALNQNLTAGSADCPFFDVSIIVNFSGYYAILGGIIMVVAYLQNMLWNLSAERQIHKIRLRFYQAIVRQEIAWFDTHKAGELTTRVSEDIDKIRNGFGDKLGLLLQYMGTCVGGIALGFTKSWKLTLVILAVAIVIMVPSIALGVRLIRKLAQNALNAYAKAGAIAEEILSSIRTVAAFGGEKKGLDRYTEKLHGAKKQSMKKDTVQAGLIGVFYFNFYGTYALAFWYGSTLFLSGELSPGDIIVCFLGILFGAFSLGQGTPYITDFITARGAASTIWEIIDQVPDIDNSSDLGLKPDSLTGDITFENVHFCYPSRPDTTVLNGLNLEVKRGQTVALVGSSGCGKSTTVQLVQRFYDPLSGCVKLDGNDLRDLNVRWLREHIGVVSQEPVLFATTIAENIRYGRTDATDEDIKAAAIEANAHDFISELPDGYETLVGDRGAQLSGGQKQRVAIARALVRNPKILLLDEATSALDTESEATVQAALDKVQAGRTTIVIAHRLSTIQNADVICSFRGGVIAEKGSHDSLMQDKEGLYAMLVQLQSRKEQKTDEEDEDKKQEENVDDDNDDDEDEEKGSKEAQNVEKEPLSSPGSRNRNISGSSDKNPDFNRMVSTHSAFSDVPDSEDDEEDVVKNFSFLRVMKLNSPELAYMIIGVICSAFSGGVQPAFAVIFSRVLQTFALPLDQVRAQVVIYCILLFSLGVLALIANVLGGVSLGKSGGNLTMRLRGMMFKAMLRQDIGWYDDHKNSSGALTTRLSTEVSLIQGVTGDRFGFIAQAFFNIGVAVIIAFIFGWQLTLLVLAFLPMIAFSGLIQTRFQRGMAATKKSSNENIGKIVTETIENIRTVASLTIEPAFIQKYTEFMAKPYRDSQRDAHLSGLTYCISQCVIFFAYAAAFRLGGWLVETCRMEFQNVFLVFSAIIFGGFGLGRAMASAPDYNKAKTAAAFMFRLIDRIPPIDSYSEKGLKPAEFHPEVSYDKVRFRYPTRPDVAVLRGLSVSVKPGETLALVGSSGCGKSTTVSIFERFYNPRAGQVSLDNNDIKILNVSWLRSQIGLVSQEPVLFDLSVADNIAYGDNTREVTTSEIIDAAKKANIHDFIASLPEGYETRVGDKGTQLSGGQKQRVAIARALVRNPKILLLDEATSALDTESEGTVQAALDKAQSGRTTLVIAHRLSTIRNADMICAFKDGVIVERGSHAQLMEIDGGVYQQLVYMQARKEEKPEEADKSEEDLDDEDKEETEKIIKENHEKPMEGAPLMDGTQHLGTPEPGTPHARTSSFKGMKRMHSVVSTHSKDGEEEETEEEKLKDFSLGRIMKLNAPEWFYIVIGSIAAGINGAVQPAFAVIFSRVLKVYSYDKVTEVDLINSQTTLFCLLFAGIGVITMVASLVQGAALGKSGEELTIRLRHMAFKAMLRQEIGWFDDKKNSTGALTTRLATEASEVQGATGARIGVMMQSLCNIGVAIIIAFIYGWQLTLLVLGFLPFIAIAGTVEWKLIQSSSQQDKEALEISGKIATEAIENIRTVASLTREETFYKSYYDLLVGPYKTNMKRAQASGLAYGLSQAIIFFAYAAAFRLGGHLVADGTMLFENVFLVFSAIIFGGFALGGATALAPDYSKAKFACANMFRLMDREPAIDSYSTEGETMDNYNPEVRFEDIRFRYPSRLDVPVLRGLTVSVKPGETLALVGSSGCGKSTSIQILEKFYNPRSGTVLLDNHGLDTLNIQWLRAQIGLVSQEPILFDRTIAENIAYGDNSREVAMTEVIEAAKKSNIHDFIASLPAGYETKVGEKGTQLSGGQKQRVAIARALVRNPKILLLDEATSALDTESEKVVQAALDEAKKGRTCITIAHRLSTIHDAEKIAVIRHGKVAEIGRHEDLMQLQGQYYSLYTKQDMQN